MKWIHNTVLNKVKRRKKGLEIYEIKIKTKIKMKRNLLKKKREKKKKIDKSFI